jgi:hypothetical protein
VNRTKVLIPVVVAVAAVAAFWFLVLAPKREEIAKLDTDVAAQEAKAEQSEQLVATYRKAKADYRANYTTIARLGKAVPADDDVRSLLVQLDSTAKRSKVNFRSLSVGGGVSAEAGTGSTGTTGELAPAPGAVPVGSAGFSAMPFTFAFSGSFFTLSDFFQRLEHFVTVQNEDIDVTGRLLLVGSIAITPDAGDLGKLEAQIGAASYLLPSTQGLTAGASPAAPAGTTPQPSDASGGATPPTTSATITGVR